MLPDWVGLTIRSSIQFIDRHGDVTITQTGKCCQWQPNIHRHNGTPSRYDGSTTREGKGERERYPSGDLAVVVPSRVNQFFVQWRNSDCIHRNYVVSRRILTMQDFQFPTKRRSSFQNYHQFVVDHHHRPTVPFDSNDFQWAVFPCDTEIMCGIVVMMMAMTVMIDFCRSSMWVVYPDVSAVVVCRTIHGLQTSFKSRVIFCNFYGNIWIWHSKEALEIHVPESSMYLC